MNGYYQVLNQTVRDMVIKLEIFVRQWKNVKKNVTPQFFKKGWGKSSHLKRLMLFRRENFTDRNKVCRMVDPNDYPVTIESDKVVSYKFKQDRRVIKAHFLSPLTTFPELEGVIPDEVKICRFHMILPVDWKTDKKRVVIQIGGTGDNLDNMLSVRHRYMLNPLLDADIGSVIVENPFYNSRKPKDQFRSRLCNVMDLFSMGMMNILESHVILHHCKSMGLGPFGITGVSLGGYMASLSACSWPYPVVLVSCLSSSTASPAFTKGVLSNQVNWDILYEQYYGNEDYKNIMDVLESPEDPEVRLRRPDRHAKHSSTGTSTAISHAGLEFNIEDMYAEQLDNPNKKEDVVKDLYTKYFHDKNMDEELIKSKYSGYMYKLFDVRLKDFNKLHKRRRNQSNVNVVSDGETDLKSEESLNAAKNLAHEVASSFVSEAKDTHLTTQQVAPPTSEQEESPPLQSDISSVDPVSLDMRMFDNVDVQKLTLDIPPPSSVSRRLTSSYKWIRYLVMVKMSTDKNGSSDDKMESNEKVVQELLMTVDSSKSPAVNDTFYKRIWELPTKISDYTTYYVKIPNFPTMSAAEWQKLLKYIDVRQIDMKTIRLQPYISSIKGKFEKSAPVVNETEEFMKMLMDDFTHLENYPIPVDQSLITCIYGSKDKYIRNKTTLPFEEIWPGAKVKVLDCGHVGGILRSKHRNVMIESIIEAFRDYDIKEKEGRLAKPDHLTVHSSETDSLINGGHDPIETHDSVDVSIETHDNDDNTSTHYSSDTSFVTHSSGANHKSDRAVHMASSKSTATKDKKIKKQEELRC